MASENSAPDEEMDAAALAAEVRALRALLQELQAELSPAVQSSLRERSTELQRQGAELDAHRDEAGRLGQALQAAEARAAELELEAARWKDAAHRGLQEIDERARAQAARFEHQTGELKWALNALKLDLAASQAEAAAASEALAAASALAEHRKAQVRARNAAALEHERLRTAMTGSLSWRITAPLRWISAALRRLLKGGASPARRTPKP